MGYSVAVIQQGHNSVLCLFAACSGLDCYHTASLRFFVVHIHEVKKATSVPDGTVIFLFSYV